MDREIMAAMLGYIEALGRSAETNEQFADHLTALARVIEANPLDDQVQEAMLTLVRRHRVDAIKGRAQAEAVKRDFVGRFGAEALKRMT